MNKNKIVIVSGVIACLLIFGIWYAIIKEIIEFKIDHECYMMSNDEFYTSKMCKPYWDYRK